MGSQPVEVVSAFLRGARAVGLVLPDGWFGRPYDNQLEPTAVHATDGGFDVELDGRQVLSLVGAETTAEANEGSLVIEGFSALTWRWVPYGSGVVHRRVYTGGQVRVVAL